MVFQSYALYPHLTRLREHRLRAAAARRCRRTRSTGACARPRAGPRPRAVARAQAARALRRPAPARRDGPRDRARAAGLPDGRAALEPRREAARADARRDRAPPARPRRDDDLRHARPGRGDDDGRPRRRDAQGRAAAGRAAAGALRPPGQPLRRRLHRQPGDEPARGDARATATASSSPRSASQTLALDDETLVERARARGVRGPRASIVGIRPEDLEDAALGADAPEDRRLHGRVELREALGSEIIVHFAIDARAGADRGGRASSRATSAPSARRQAAADGDERDDDGRALRRRARACSEGRDRGRRRHARAALLRPGDGLGIYDETTTGGARTVSRTLDRMCCRRSRRWRALARARRLRRRRRQQRRQRTSGERGRLRQLSVDRHLDRRRAEVLPGRDRRVQRSSTRT